MPITSDNVPQIETGVSRASKNPASLYDSEPCLWPCSEFLHETNIAGSETLFDAQRCRVCEALYREGLLLSPPLERR